MNTRSISLLGLISVGSFIVVVAVISVIAYCAIKLKRRSVSSSARSNYRGSMNQTAMEELDIDITHNSAYGQVKEPQQVQDGAVVYEENQR